MAINWHRAEPSKGNSDVIFVLKYCKDNRGWKESIASADALGTCLMMPDVWVKVHGLYSDGVLYVQGRQPNTERGAD